jgi:hypothetical protein
MFEQRRNFLSIAIVVLFLASCADDDRTLTVGCEQMPNGDIVVPLSALSGEDSSRARTGFLNTSSLVPGTLIELTRKDSEKPGYRPSVPHLLHVTDTDYLPPKLYGWLVGEVTEGPFRSSPDIDLNQKAKSAGVDIDREISHHTVFITMGMAKDIRRFDLKDPIGLINSDGDALATIRENPQKRFLVISGAAYGKRLFFMYSGQKLRDLSSVHLHLNYRCPSIRTLNSPENPLTNDMALIFFYVPLSYDALNKRVQRDNRPIDFEQDTVIYSDGSGVYGHSSH